MKNKKVSFNNEIVKQGNSYCIRIPKRALEYMGIELGDTVSIILSKPKEEKLPKNLLDIYRKEIKELKEFSDKELNGCFFNLSIENKAKKGLKNMEIKRISEAFEKTIELQKGNNFLKKYKIFKNKVMIPNNSLKIINKMKNSKFKELADVIEMQMKL